MADKLRDAQTYFGDKAEAYRQSASHGASADLDRMLRLLDARPGLVALDVATGGGHTARALRDAGCATVTCDATPQMRPDVLCDAHRLPFRDASFDVVASRIAPHHFTDLPRFVAEAARVLRPGGALYVFDLASPDDDEAAAIVNRIESLRDPSHVWSWPLPVWHTAASAARLTIERLQATASELDLEPWIARARMDAAREAEVRRLLAENGAETLGGYGLTPEGRMRVLRVEMVARKG